MREPRPATTPTHRECDTRWLLALAALLIANSHLEAFYPARWLAADGLLGNSIFFFLSGYGVMRSELANRRPFATFYFRRVLRIYPALWLAEIVFCAVSHGWHDWTLREWLRQFIWPTHYAFVAQVMIFYVPVFFLARLGSRRIFQFALLLVALAFGWFYVGDLRAGGLDTLSLGNRHPWLWHALFLWLMLLGAWAGLPRVTRARRLKWWLLPLLFGTYGAAKFLMVRGWKIPALGISSANGYALLFALVAAMLWQFIRLAEDGRLAFALRQIPFVSGATAFVGALTLEIYLFHGFVQSVEFIRDLRFPFNVAVFFAATFLVSWLVARLVKTLRRVAARFLPSLAAAD